MQGQHTPLFIPISARSTCNNRRAHSQPTYKIRSQNRIKINIKRLPTDFFHPSISDIENLDLTSQQRSATQAVRRSPRMADSKNYQTLDKLRSGVPVRGNSDFEPRRKRIVSEQTIERQKSIENQNIMNWTFSRQMFCDQKAKKIINSIKVPPCSPLHTGPSKEAERVKEQCMPKQVVPAGSERVKTLLSEKITELNLNRLKLNVRKNNHPQSYMQYIKRVFL